METKELQQKLAQQRHLLPSQQELLNRLLFQLAFNDFQHIGLVGAAGSGKSTLALALAELFSEQANVALLTGPLAEHELEALLSQHWFGQRQAEPSLAELMAEPLAGALPLLLIVDNFDQLSDAARHKLLQLDCLGFFMSAQSFADMALNLSINLPTLQDAGLVLQDKILDPLAIAERFAAGAGNMHLFHSAIVKSEERKSHRAVIWLLPTAIVLLLLAALISWNLPPGNEATQPTDIAATAVVSPPSPVPAASIEPLARDESTDTAELTNASALTVTAELSDNMPELLEIPQLAEAAGLIDTSELVTIPPIKHSNEAVVEPVPETYPAVVSGGVADAIAAATPLYQEQQLVVLPAQFRVLQLAVLSSERALQRFMQAYPEAKIAVYQRSWQGQLQWVVLTKDAYPDVSTARQARATLAEPLRAAGPFIKPVAQVQQEIKALARLRAEPVLQE